MKYSLALAALAAAPSSAHYIFQQLTEAGTKYPVFEYIRKNTNYNSPVTDLDSNDLRCNVGGSSGASTETLDVKAGSSFTFTLDTPVYHQGPVSLYMSKAPGAVSDYDGSGPWFKIKDWGPTFTGGSASWKLDGSYTYTIPTCIPDGEYLLRIQSLGIHNPWPAGIPQFYISCAQIKVSGGTASTIPGPTALIPGFISESDPGYTANIYSNFNSYQVPGPAVMECGTNGGGGGNGGDPTTMATSAKPTSTRMTTTTKPTTMSTSTKPATTTAGGCAAQKWAQCGGNGWTGCTACVSGSTCNAINDYYSQCV